MDLNAFEKFAIEIAFEAGSIIRRGISEQKSYSTKGTDIDLVTEYDKEVHEYLTGKILSTFPNHRTWSEESAVGERAHGFFDEGYVWHVDPIDGTINFVHGYPFFAVSLALYKENQPLVGVIYDPVHGECFSAIDGNGARLLSGGKSQSFYVSDASKLVDSLVATGFPYDRHQNPDDNLAQTAAFLKKVRGLRRSGSAALDLAYVALGRLDGYWEFRINSWDVAAGVLLIAEAGGTVTLTGGQAFQLRPQVSLVASNGRIHGPMLNVLESVKQST
jgi:myo-inositol-1(or 4)-monophosphatase